MAKPAFLDRNRGPGSCSKRRSHVSPEGHQRLRRVVQTSFQADATGPAKPRSTAFSPMITPLAAPRQSAALFPPLGGQEDANFRRGFAKDGRDVDPGHPGHRQVSGHLREPFGLCQQGATIPLHLLPTRVFLLFHFPTTFRQQISPSTTQPPFFPIASALPCSLHDSPRCTSTSECRRRVPPVPPNPLHPNPFPAWHTGCV